MASEFLQTLGRQILARNQHQWLARQQSYRSEVGDRVKRRLLVEKLAVGHCTSDEEDPIAVGRCLCHATGADCATCSGDVLNDDWTAEISLICCANKRPTASVGPPAGYGTTSVIGLVGQS